LEIIIIIPTLNPTLLKIIHLKILLTLLQLSTGTKEEKITEFDDFDR